mmetsp:Transcript_6528/g.14423  ORF Transcript_6528/g.14423 Transcript_6528/m.14423 type:complete len:115 (+) Transcript_6528:390-734(+)
MAFDGISQYNDAYRFSPSWISRRALPINCLEFVFNVMDLILFRLPAVLYSFPIVQFTSYVVMAENVSEVTTKGCAPRLSYVFEEEISAFFVTGFGGGESSLPSIQIWFMNIVYA